MAKTVAKFLKVAGHFRNEQLKVEEPTQLDVATLLRRRRNAEHSQYDRVFLCVDSLVATPDFEKRLRNILIEASCPVAVLDVAYSKKLEALVVAGSGRYLARASEMEPIPWIADAFGELNPSIETDAFLTVENEEVPSQVSFVSHVPNEITGIGNLRALVAGMVKGVNKGFEKNLNLVGVGYQAQAQGQKLNLQIGFSHPVTKDLPAGVTVKTQSPTEILIKGADRRVVGQIAAEVRAARPPEPFRGRGVRHFDERAVSKKSKRK
ncbi:hypothetical protein AT984_12905 [Paucibacter sp. KCTC 42545]|nr:hypothetical protein AT984_12905 [Paucibacter sp. KCTC 42545]